LQITHLFPLTIKSSKEHWQFQEQHATTNNMSPRNKRRSARTATTGAATATTTKRRHTARAADGLDRGAAPDVLAFGSSRRIWKRTRL
jgi:hypothetical protein